jgi:hypothetical protein
MVVKAAIAGSKVFDVDQPLSGAQASEFVLAGYVGCIRYFPLNSSNVPGCLTALELQVLLTAGLAVAAVQHVDSPPWYPTAALGTSHGQYMAAYGKAIGYPTGSPMYCDIESVATGTAAKDVIDYFTNWASEVTAAGYVAGLYVGWEPGMSPQQIYDLPTKSYWRAYNYDDGVPVRGFQIVQHTEKTLGGVTFDPNTVQVDELGDLPIFVFGS